MASGNHRCDTSLKADPQTWRALIRFAHAHMNCLLYIVTAIDIDDGCVCIGNRTYPLEITPPSITPLPKIPRR